MIERQLVREELDGLIEAAKSNVNTLPLSDVRNVPSQQPPTPTSEPSQDNKFMSAGVGWTITFRGETCIVPQMIGLDYISVLLQHPGQEMSALQLQALTAGMTAQTPPLDDARTGRSYERDMPTRSEAFFRDELIDEKTSRQLIERMGDLEQKIALKQESGDLDTEDLQKELAKIRKYLGASLNHRNRPRAFADPNEKARQSITQALSRAYRSIRQQAPQTAHHFESLINRGSAFSYRDSVTQWHLCRSQQVPRPH
jgi:hypothetical protein